MGDNRSRIEVFADRVDSLLSMRASSRSSLNDIVRKRVSSVLKECGYQKRSPGNLALIDAALLQRGIHTHPRIVDRRLPLDRWIVFNRVPETDAKRLTLFTTERALHKFIVDNFDLIDEFRALRKVKSEYQLPSGRKVDLYCRDMTTGDHVLMEFKKGAPDDRMLTQIVRYIDELTPRAGDKSVRGILITGEGDASVERALAQLRTHYSVTWLRFQLALTFEEVTMASADF